MGSAGGVDEDGGHAAAVAPGAVDAQQEHHAGNGGHGVGDGKKQDRVFGLTIIAGVSGKSMIKGLISACLGLLISCVGSERR